MPTVTTGAVVSGATTTSSPFASLVPSIPTWSRFTRCPPSPLLFVSQPRNSSPIRPTCQRDPSRARSLPGSSALRRHRQILSAIPEERANAPAPLGNLRERADPSMPFAAPASRNYRALGGSGATTRAWLRCASCPARRATAWQLPRPPAHDQRPSPLRRDTKVSCFPRCALAIRRVLGQFAARLAPLVLALRW